MTDSPYSLVIFDCDGTLADTEPAHNQAISEELIAMGLTEYTPEKCTDTFIGTAIPAIMKLIEDKHGVKFADDFIENHIDHAISLLADNMSLDPTTPAVLRTLYDSPIKIAVGSNGNKRTVLSILKQAGFDQFFPDEHVFTFEDVARPKPAPDLYLHVCSQMGVNPEHAIVIEDTVKGAMGGINANIDTIGYVGLTHRENIADRLSIAGCKKVMKSMQELLSILKL